MTAPSSLPSALPPTASPGSGSSQPPSPRSAALPVDASGEPLGYNLEAGATYEQPPAPPQPYRQSRPVPAARAPVVTGFAVALLGLLASPLALYGTVVFSAIGTLMSGAALDQSRRARSPYPRLAVAGLVLGIIGLIIGVVLFVVAAVSDTLP